MNHTLVICNNLKVYSVNPLSKHYGPPGLKYVPHLKNESIHEIPDPLVNTELDTVGQIGSVEMPQFLAERYNLPFDSGDSNA